MAALLERLHAKHNASRPWQETSKIVRQAMVRQLYFISFKINVTVTSIKHACSKAVKNKSEP